MKTYYFVFFIFIVRPAWCLNIVNDDFRNSVSSVKSNLEDKKGKAQEIEELYIRRTSLKNNLNAITVASHSFLQSPTKLTNIRKIRENYIKEISAVEYQIRFMEDSRVK